MAILNSILILLCILIGMGESAQILLDTYSYTDGDFKASFYIEKLAYHKLVEVVYFTEGRDFNFVRCGYRKSFNNSHELWDCDSFIDGLTKFYGQYQVNGQMYFDKNNADGYLVPKVPAVPGAKPKPPRPAQLPGCQTYEGYDSCNGNQVSYNEDARRTFQTYPRGTPEHHPSYQDYSHLTGYADIVYNGNRDGATVTFVTFSRKGSPAVEYNFGSGWTKDKSIYVSGNVDSITPRARFVDNSATLDLDPVYFPWTLPKINRPETEGGQKGSIVELFGWRYVDIEKECELLGKAGYMGLKIWPPNEHVMSDEWSEPDGQFNPWYFAYQPVSYRLFTRSGTLSELRSMIKTCRGHGVRVYADAVINHMSAGGNAVNPKRNNWGQCIYFGPKNSSAHSPYFTHSFTYNQNPNGARWAMEYPAVPYTMTDFHCDRPLRAHTDPFELNYGWLVGLSDLNTEKDYVRERIAAYLVTLQSVGFSGYRIDAARHISPDNIAAIMGKFMRKMGGSLPEDFITWLEVLIGGEKDLLACQYNNYNFYQYLNDALKRNGLSDRDIYRIKLWSADYPKEWPICGWWILPSERFVIQTDDHDQQNDGSSSRDLADKGTVLIKSRDVGKHRWHNIELFARRDANWKIRNILSGYSFADGVGFPDGFSDCKRYKGNARCRGVAFKPGYVKDACGYSVVQNGQWVQGEYTRTHRDIRVINAMRQWMGLPETNAHQLGMPNHCQ